MNALSMIVLACLCGVFTAGVFSGVAALVLWFALKMEGRNR